jgi:hypothetical protein
MTSDGSATGAAYSEELGFCKEATPGNHKLEVLAADSCCDETLAWYFVVDDGDWMELSV